jgi:hypothetical protein
VGEQSSFFEFGIAEESVLGYWERRGIDMEAVFGDVYLSAELQLLFSWSCFLDIGSQEHSAEERV